MDIFTTILTVFFEVFRYTFFFFVYLSVRCIYCEWRDRQQLVLFRDAVNVRFSAPKYQQYDVFTYSDARESLNDEISQELNKYEWDGWKQKKEGNNTSDVKVESKSGHFSKKHAKFNSPNFRGNSYQILAIPENASASEINKAYRRWVKLYHPDHVTHLGENAIARARVQTVLLTRAREEALSKLQKFSTAA